MDLKAQLLVAHSKRNATYISDYIGTDKKRFSQLMKLFFVNENIITQRAAYSVGISVDKYPSLIKPYIKKIIDNLEYDLHDAVKRNTVRILQEIEIPVSHQGKLTELCFNFLTSNSEPIAVKAFSMTILYNMVKKYPDLKNELQIVIDSMMDYESSGIKARGRKILRLLEKIK